jgi:hypothetical protein
MKSIYFRIYGKYFLSPFKVTVTTISIPVYKGKGKGKAVPALAY